MALYLNDDQTMLADTARPFLAERAPVAHMRSLRDGKDPDGFSRDLWREFAQMGFNGVLAAEDHGGLGLGHVEAGIILEEIGRNLTPSPFLATAVGAVVALRQANEALRERWLPGIVAGETVAAVVLEERTRHDPLRSSLRADRVGDDYRLTGHKRFVIFGQAADLLLVLARTSGLPGDAQGMTLFAIEVTSSGIELATERLVDSSIAASLTFRDTRVGASAVIGQVDRGFEALGPVLNALRLGAAAELVGLAAGAFDLTIEHLKVRQQFGCPIGSFQALQHRAAHLYSELEVARSAVLKAQQLLDSGDPAATRAVHVAKAIASLTANLAVQEGVQLHGGVGMTDEYAIGLYMKRARVLAEMYGDADFHVDAVAKALGF